MKTMDFKKIFSSALPLVALLIAGCTREIIIPEVLQLPVDAPVYTKCNIWFEDPAAISSMNYQTGRVLPIGTRVQPEYADDDTLIFTDENGVRYVINFSDEEMLIPMKNFILNTLTLSPPEELLKDVSPLGLEKIKQAAVAPGMTREEVIFSFGVPCPGRTPSLDNSSYIYYQSPRKSFRVNFKGNVVSKVVPPIDNQF